MQEITFERLLDVINKFGEVAKCSVEAGFDFLEFHCAHNYLPHSMFSSGINIEVMNGVGALKINRNFHFNVLKLFVKIYQKTCLYF